MKILNFGSLNLDYVYHVDHFVRAGETISSVDLQLFCGGKGLNQSIALSSAGARVYHAGAVGKDKGDILLNTLVDSGVDVSFVRCKDVQTGHAIIQIQPDGENCILLYGGANKTLDEQDIDITLQAFEKEDYLILQNEVNNMPYIMKQARERGMKIVLNPSPMNDEILNLPLSYVDYFILNEIEIEAFVPEKITINDRLSAFSRKFPEAGIVLTLGGKGVLYQGPEGSFKHGRYKVNAIDTTAAGDTFTGYFIAMISDGYNIGKALEYASKAAAIVVSRKGAAVSIPKLTEVENSDLTLLNTI